MVLISRIDLSTSYHFVKQLPRDIGCSEITTTTYSFGGSIFDIQCNAYWSWYDYLYTTFAVDFSTCISKCSEWNTNQSDKCVGVTWFGGEYGPGGPSGGSQCYLLWQLALDSNGTLDSSDSAIIHDTPIVHSSRKNLLISRRRLTPKVHLQTQNACHGMETYILQPVERNLRFSVVQIGPTVIYTSTTLSTSCLVSMGVPYGIPTPAILLAWALYTRLETMDQTGVKVNVITNGSCRINQRIP